MGVRTRHDHQLLADDARAGIFCAAAAIAAAAARRLAVCAAAAAAAVKGGEVHRRLLQQEDGVAERLGQGGVAAAAATGQRQRVQPRPHVCHAVTPVRALRHGKAAGVDRSRGAQIDLESAPGLLCLYDAASKAASYTEAPRHSCSASDSMAASARTAPEGRARGVEDARHLAGPQVAAVRRPQERLDVVGSAGIITTHVAVSVCRQVKAHGFR